MRRLPALLLTLVAAAALAACSAGAAPGWTYAPAPSTTPAPSGAASAEPSAAGSPPAAGSPVPSATAQPIASASAQPAPSGSGGAGAALTVTATTTSATSGWDPATLETAASTAFTLTFDNQDTTVQHNLVLQDAAGGPVAIQGDTAPFLGPAKRDFQVPALTAGDYKYVCQIHPVTMVGTLSVK